MTKTTITQTKTNYKMLTNTHINKETNTNKEILEKNTKAITNSHKNRVIFGFLKVIRI